MEKRNWSKIAILALVALAFFILWKKKKKILYGCLLAEHDHDQTLRKMKQTGLYMTREAIYFSKDTHTKNIDDFLSKGYYVQINFNWKPTGNPVMFPTDLNMIREKAEEFFQYYEPQKEKIIVVCENEWDNGHYREEIIVQDYLNELAIVVEVGHKYGFKVCDAGTTGNTLERWTYNQLNGESAKWWRERYFVGLDNEYEEMLAMMEEYTTGIRNIPIDYINTHWYNDRVCYNGYPIAIVFYKNACGKEDTPLANNEWGIKTKSQQLFEDTLNEVNKAGAKVSVAYSGTGEPKKAIELTNDMLVLLK